MISYQPVHMHSVESYLKTSRKKRGALLLVLIDFGKMLADNLPPNLQTSPTDWCIGYLSLVAHRQLISLQ